MSGQNTLIPNLTMNGRKEYVKQADIHYLVKGVALLAGEEYWQHPVLRQSCPFR